MQAVLDAVADRLMEGDEILIRIPEICDATGVNYGSVYHHFGSREGVIDAAYDMIFTRLVEEDIRTFRDVNESVETLEEYVKVMSPIVSRLSSGPERKVRRAMRFRIVAAASTRPRLKELIGKSQARLTNDLRQLTEYAQSRNWLRDDVSADPVEEAEWEHMIGVLFFDLLSK